MNPKTSLSKQQIRAIFRYHHLSDSPSIERINIGFTNEIHQVDNFILKVCVRPNFEEKFNNEVELYQKLQGKALVPKFVLADNSRAVISKPYMIYWKIPGQSLGNHWHLLTNTQRRQIIKTFCRQMRIVSGLELHPHLEQNQTWQDFVLSELHNDLATIHRQQLLDQPTQDKVSDFIDFNKQVLDKQRLALTYWDTNLDNIIINETGEMTGLIDFEHVSVMSLDYALEMPRQIMRYPWLTLSAEMEKYADQHDYEHLLEWFEEFYPELFDFPDLGRRLDLYELEGILRQLPRFPRARQLHDRLAGLIDGKNKITPGQGVIWRPDYP